MNFLWNEHWKYEQSNVNDRIWIVWEIFNLSFATMGTCAKRSANNNPKSHKAELFQSTYIIASTKIVELYQCCSKRIVLLIQNCNTFFFGLSINMDGQLYHIAIATAASTSVSQLLLSLLMPKISIANIDRFLGICCSGFSSYIWCVFFTAVYATMYMMSSCQVQNDMIYASKYMCSEHVHAMLKHWTFI